MTFRDKKRIFVMIILILFLMCTIHITVATVNHDDRAKTEVFSTYIAVPEEETVKVSKEIIFFNMDTSTQFMRGYYSSYNYYLPENAKNIEARDDAGYISFEKSPNGYHVFNFKRKVWFEQSYTFHIEYELQINHNTAVFALHESGSNTEVTLKIPSDFDTQIGRSDYTLKNNDDQNIYVFEKGKHWNRTYTVDSVRSTPYMVLTGTADLKEKDVEIEIRYWEGEELWAQETMQTTIESLKILEEKWGIPYPVCYNISITQANIDQTGGYGGYNKGSQGIWLLHSSSQWILIHELAHYWTREFNFEQLWMDEGYADLYAYLVLKEIDPHEAQKRRENFIKRYNSLKDTHEYPLSEWSTPPNITDHNMEYVTFGYTKSFYLKWTIYDSIGIESLKEINKDLITYEGGICNPEYIHTVNSLANQDMSFIYDYIFDPTVNIETNNVDNHLDFI